MTVQQTSLDAYAEVNETGQANQILAAIKEHETNGATCHEIAVFLEKHTSLKGLHYGTVAARMSGLKDKNLIIHKGVKRKTPSGNDADVFIAIDYATNDEKYAAPQHSMSKKEVLREIVKNVDAYMAGLIKSNAVDGIWKRGMELQLSELKKAKELLS